MGLFRKIGKVVSGKPKDIKDMTVSQLKVLQLQSLLKKQKYLLKL